MEENKKSGLKLNGAPWYIALGCILIILASAYLGVLGTDMASVLALCVAIAVIFNEIGERLPIWNSYIGGGLLMVFFGTAVLVQFNLIPEKYVEGINTFISGDTGFLTFFIIFLIAGSILSLERDILLKSFAGYIPAILGGLVCAMLFGVVTGFVFGIRPSDILIKYVLPIMGGGNGAGAVPLSQIYEEVTGDPAANYYAFAIIILTIANIICILAGALLNKLGTVKTEWTGDKRNLLRNNAGLAREDRRQGHGRSHDGSPDLLRGGPPVLQGDPSHNLWSQHPPVCVHDYFRGYSGRNGNYPGQYLRRSQAPPVLYDRRLFHHHHGRHGM